MKFIKIPVKGMRNIMPDEMVSKYTNVSVPACGFSIGFERLINILMESNYQIPNDKEKYAFIIDSDEFKINKEKYLIEISKLREKNIMVNVQLKSKNLNIKDKY